MWKKINDNIEVISMILIAITTSIMTLAIYFLPDTVAMHFDVSMQSDRYGSRYELMLISVIFIGTTYAVAAIGYIAGSKVFAQILGYINAVINIIYFFVAIFVVAIVCSHADIKYPQGDAEWTSFVSSLCGGLMLLGINIYYIVTRNHHSQFDGDKMFPTMAYKAIYTVTYILAFSLALVTLMLPSYLQSYYSLIALGISVAGVAVCMLCMMRYGKKRGEKRKV